MVIDEPLRTLAEYECALKEIEDYFENQPEPGTEAADRFSNLVAVIKAYEDVHFPIPAETGSAMVYDNGTRDDLISRFEEGLMLASDKQYILSMLRSSAPAASSPEIAENFGTPEHHEAATVCAELYQIIGCLAEELGVLAHPDVQRALDNASAHRLVHRDLLPWPKQPLRSAWPLDP